MSEIGKKIDQVLKLGLANYLKSNGFKKSGRNWRKQTQDDWLLVNAQASSINKGELGKFAVNLGIYNYAIEQLAQRLHYKEGELPVATGATLECRLNTLGYNNVHWWEIGEDTDLQKVSNDVVEKMDKFGLPWLLANNNVNSISDVMADSMGRVSIAASMVLGDEQEAIRRAQAFIQNRPHGAKATLAWAKSVGLEIKC